MSRVYVLPSKTKSKLGPFAPRGDRQERRLDWNAVQRTEEDYFSFLDAYC